MKRQLHLVLGFHPNIPAKSTHVSGVNKGQVRLKYVCISQKPMEAFIQTQKATTKGELVDKLHKYLLPRTTFN